MGGNFKAGTPDEIAAGFTDDTDLLLALVHPELRGPVRPRPDLAAVTTAVRQKKHRIIGRSAYSFAANSPRGL
mgnify:CR=1 FL=1